MYNYLLYLLQCTAWFVPLYLLYLTLYRRFTFFALNRLYLLAVLVLSMVMPLVKYTQVNYTFVSNLVNDTPLSLKNTNQVNTVPASLNTLTINKIIIPTKTNKTSNVVLIISSLYILGAVILLAKLLNSLLAMQRLISRVKLIYKGNTNVVYTTTEVPHSSFFNYIFINQCTTSNADLQKIIYHEMQHYEKLHTIDVLLCEVLKVIFWFNPLVYYYKRSVQEVHEFEVDDEMTKLYAPHTYAELLVQVATHHGYSLINTFSTSPLKTRLMMLFNPKTYAFKKLSFLLIVPVVATLLIAYGNISSTTIAVQASTKLPITLYIDAGYGGKDEGAINKNTIKESTLTLQLAVLLKTEAEAAGYKVVLSRDNDTSYLGLQHRLIHCKSSQANILLSLQASNNADVTKNGIEYYVNNNPTSAVIGNAITNKMQNLKGIKVKPVPSKCKEGTFILTTNIPSVLLELGCLSNVNDVAFITNSAMQKLMVKYIVDGLQQYSK